MAYHPHTALPGNHPASHTIPYKEEEGMIHQSRPVLDGSLMVVVVMLTLIAFTPPA